LGKLDELGYFRYTPPVALESTREIVAGTEFPFFEEESGRFFWADAENIAEKGAASFVESLAPTLRQIGVDMGPVEEDWGDDYWITVGGERHVIWAREEAEEARALAAVRTFAIVNDHLIAAGSEERLYAVWGDNDMVAVLLTAELVEYLSSGVSQYSKPYVPRNEPPWYGMPHESAE